MNKKSCYECPQNIRCFVHKLHVSLREALNQNSIINVFDDLAPQTWYCDFLNPLHNYTIIKYEDSEEGYSKIGAAFDDLFKEAGIPSHERETIRGRLLNGSTLRSIRESRAILDVREQLLLDNDLLKKVVEIYYHDFVVFGFPFPVLYSG
ncbi:hypothetical protein ANCCAN_15436 [Ancylostoma caninum]|uniref:Uncharacterized protein n=1 Tax=Ancylostoma caninum TaxID=29170 RepID=A0A368G7I5_ANCCA|nr:hypothetical protein ANCCAN_15436 [Ancylostoma caninum]